jgi:hypothetical protein
MLQQASPSVAALIFARFVRERIEHIERIHSLVSALDFDDERQKPDAKDGKRVSIRVC